MSCEEYKITSAEVGDYSEIATFISDRITDTFPKLFQEKICKSEIFQVSCDKREVGLFDAPTKFFRQFFFCEDK